MQFKTEQITLDFKTLTIDLTVIENLDELFEALVNKGTDHPDVVDERIPYWADLWASAIGLSRYLVDNQTFVKGKDVLEIGCGLGLPAIVAGELGAGHTIATDYLPEALDFAQLNWQQNLPLENVEFKVLDWRNIPKNFSKNVSETSERVGEEAPQYKADILLAADVAYEKRAFEPLLNAFHQLVKPDGKILIAEPNRFISKDFFENLTNQGFRVEKTTLEVARRGHAFTVNVFELQFRDFD
jgi:predicted nicotinamide N-methyase